MQPPGRGVDASSAAAAADLLYPPREGLARRVRSEQTASSSSTVYNSDRRSPAGKDPAESMRWSASRDDMVFKSSSSIKYTLPDPLVSHGVSASERRSRRSDAAAAAVSSAVPPRYEPSLGMAAPVRRLLVGREGVTDYIEQRAAAAGLSGDSARTRDEVQGTQSAAGRSAAQPSIAVPARVAGPRVTAAGSKVSGHGSSSSSSSSSCRTGGGSAGSSSGRPAPVREGLDRRPADIAGGESSGLGLVGRRYDPIGVLVGAPRGDANPPAASSGPRGSSSRSQPQAPSANNKDMVGPRRSSDRA